MIEGLQAKFNQVAKKPSSSPTLSIKNSSKILKTFYSKTKLQNDLEVIESVSSYGSSSEQPDENRDINVPVTSGRGLNETVSPTVSKEDEVMTRPVRRTVR